MDYPEYLAQLLSCAYLSDLRYRTITAAQAKAILAEPVRFPPEQYTEAARYILGDTTLAFASPTEALRAITSFLTRPG